MDSPKLDSKKRYMAWFEAYMPEYLKTMPAEEAYALRCVVLHHGGLSTQPYKLRSPKSSMLLDKYILTVNNSSNLHKFTNCGYNGIMIPNLVVLDAPTYCKDLLDAVARWEETKGKRLEDYEEMLRLHDGVLDLGFARIA